jgi:hypothetical protein
MDITHSPTHNEQVLTIFLNKKLKVQYKNTKNAHKTMENTKKMCERTKIPKNAYLIFFLRSNTCFYCIYTKKGKKLLVNLYIFFTSEVKKYFYCLKIYEKTKIHLVNNSNFC